MLNELSLRIYGAITGAIASLKQEEGQDLLEYALLGGLIAAGIVAVLVLMSGNITEMVTNIGECIDFDNGSTCAPGF